MQTDRTISVVENLFHSTRVRLLLLLAVALALYLPTLNGVFIWDDPIMLWDNPMVMAPHGGLWRIWSGREGADYFPLTTSLFWVEWRLWGDTPFGYRLVNVMLHAGSAIILWRILLRLRIHGAWFAGLLLVLQPLAVASVAWIAELKNTLSLPLLLLAVLAYLRFDAGEGRRWYAAALGLFLLALLAKTSVVMLPVLLLLLLCWRHGAWRWRDAWRSVPFFVFSLVLGLVTVWFQWHQGDGVTAPYGASDFFTRLAVAGNALWFYLGKALIPTGLCAIYPCWEIDPYSWTAYLPIVAWGAATAVAWYWRRTSPGMALWLLLAAQTIMLLPVLGFVNMSFHQYSWVADHLAYVTIPVVCAFAGAAGAWLWRQPRTLARTVAVTAVITGVGAWTAAASRQVQFHQHPATMWDNVIARNPDVWIGHQNAGEALIREAREGGAGNLNPAVLEQARALFLEAYRRQPQGVTCFYLGFVHDQLALPVAAEQWFRRALELNPADAWSADRLRALLLRQGRHAGAEHDGPRPVPSDAASVK